jgi:hypothetical protein
MDAIMVIHPYKLDGVWMFDDDTAGLVRKALAPSAGEMIERLVTDIPQAHDGFSLVFSAEPFSASEVQLQWRREASGGNWYYSPELDAEVLLGRGLLKYFPFAPKRIYVEVKEKSAMKASDLRKPERTIVR